jgi:hypothetical protein
MTLSVRQEGLQAHPKNEYCHVTEQDVQRMPGGTISKSLGPGRLAIILHGHDGVGTDGSCKKLGIITVMIVMGTLPDIRGIQNEYPKSVHDPCSQPGVLKQGSMLKVMVKNKNTNKNPAGGEA